MGGVQKVDKEEKHLSDENDWLEAAVRINSRIGVREFSLRLISVSVSFHNSSSCLLQRCCLVNCTNGY